MTPDDQTAYEVLLERIDGVRVDLSHLREGVKCLEKQANGYMTEYAKTTVRIENHDERIRNLEGNFDKLKDLIRPLIATNKILSYLGGVLGGSVLLLIWMMITGQVSVLF